MAAIHMVLAGIWLVAYVTTRQSEYLILSNVFVASSGVCTLLKVRTQ